MRRNLLFQIWQRQETCLFCSFRPSRNQRLRTFSTPQQHRHLYSSVKPSQASAPAEQQDDDHDFSMLKQNAGLAFPTRQKPQNTQTERERSTFTPISRNAGTARFQARHHDGQKAPNTTGKQHRAQRGQQQKSSTFGHDDGLKIRRLAVQDRGDSDTQFGSKRVRSGGGNIAEGQQRSWQSQERHQERNHSAQDGHRDDRTNRRPRMDSRSDKSSQKFTEFRVFNADRPGPGLATTNSSDPRSAVQGEAENIPIATDTMTESTESRRRRLNPEKKSRRSDRFDDGEDEEAVKPRTTKTKSKRGKDFDFDAYEAEDNLFGEGARRSKKKKSQKRAVSEASSRPALQLPDFISVEKLARLLKVDTDHFIEKLEEEGYEGARYDHILDAGTSAMFADLYGFEPVMAQAGSVSDLAPRPLPDDVSTLDPRPPIVTIMGHVDHGKTTILDYFRKSSVVSSEHGGITQHIGAFSVTMPTTNRKITFLDTPGHAAFLEMRRRGANVTDIVVLVVAADDSVKPQTIEAIKHALEAKVQIIVAINKIDKPEADVERVKQDLTRHDIVVEDYGGDFQVIPVSGKTGQGMSDLEEAIITLADVNDYRAEKDGLVEGWVIESKVTIAGRAATVLVRRGTLRIGDCIVAGTTWAKVRTLRDENGETVAEAAPGTPVQVDGWRGLDPTAGLEVLQAETEDHAKDVVDLRLEQEDNMRKITDMAAINTARSDEAEERAKVVAWEREQEWANKHYGRRPKDNTGWIEAQEADGPKKVHFVIKADVAGSVEAVVAAVAAIGNGEITTNIVHSGTGPLTESDMRMLATTGEGGYAISFNQSVDNSVSRLAETAGLTILDHNIIYKVTDNVKTVLGELLPPIVTQKVVGEAEVGQIFEVTVKRQKLKIAGCRVTNGTISRSHKVRVQRAGEVVFTGSLHSLKHVKKDVTEMRKGTECGMGFEEWEDFQEGDQVQCLEEHQEKRTLY